MIKYDGVFLSSIEFLKVFKICKVTIEGFWKQLIVKFTHIIY